MSGEQVDDHIPILLFIALIACQIYSRQQGDVVSMYLGETSESTVLTWTQE